MCLNLQCVFVRVRACVCVSVCPCVCARMDYCFPLTSSSFIEANTRQLRNATQISLLSLSLLSFFQSKERGEDWQPSAVQRYQWKAMEKNIERYKVEQHVCMCTECKRVSAASVHMHCVCVCHRPRWVLHLCIYQSALDLCCNSVQMQDAVSDRD